jgi:chromosome segregation ATPase
MLDNDTMLPAAPSFTQIVEYGVTEAAIAIKRAEFAALEATTPQGYEAVRKAIAECRQTRVGIEQRRKEYKQGALEYGKLVDAKAKEATALIESVENPLQAKKDAVDAEKARIKKQKDDEERAKVEAAIRAKREAEEAELRAKREAEQKRLDEERAAFAAEKAKRDEEQRAIDEANRIERERLAKIQAEIDERNRLESVRLAEQQRAIDAEREKVRLEKEAADRTEAIRVASIKAADDARLKAEQDARDAEAKRVADAEKAEAEKKRLEALRPDREKLASFADWIAEIVGPDVGTDDAKAVLAEAMKRLSYTALKLREFAGA